ncbi:unnamed protein product, partial [Trichogramma brassicae]
LPPLPIHTKPVQTAKGHTRPLYDCMPRARDLYYGGFHRIFISTDGTQSKCENQSSSVEEQIKILHSENSSRTVSPITVNNIYRTTGRPLLDIGLSHGFPQRPVGSRPHPASSCGFDNIVRPPCCGCSN